MIGHGVVGVLQREQELKELAHAIESLSNDVEEAGAQLGEGHRAELG